MPYFLPSQHSVTDRLNISAQFLRLKKPVPRSPSMRHHATEQRFARTPGNARVRHMPFFRRPHPLLAWTLCLGVLLSLHFCGLHHGQAGGLALSGLQAAFCSASGSGPGDMGVAEEEADSWRCPLCQTPVLSDTSQNAGWRLSTARRAPLVARRLGKKTSRRRWPMKHPRAP